MCYNAISRCRIKQMVFFGCAIHSSHTTSCFSKAWKGGVVAVLLCNIVMGGSRDSLYLNGVTGRFGIHWIGTSWLNLMNDNRTYCSSYVSNWNLHLQNISSAFLNNILLVCEKRHQLMVHSVQWTRRQMLDGLPWLRAALVLQGNHWEFQVLSITSNLTS